ncbi:hypothetical protein GCM10025857_24950 [Alicyclobacillus contaminans]|uniref:hypothetical protein n=1 Tax=Alicyclobacillus contaminans TaxID=392016 RepID=UPI0012EB4251|nr:hypothetical protein [Alicyclobacillus contaminans]GMA51138.1 hypothetical protein GCM10025857_24950 [Alicyclobacillus contaminans]
MVRRFWRTMFALTVLSIAFTTASWAYLFASGVAIHPPALRSQLLSLPTGIPSLWSVVQPDTDTVWWAPIIVLLVQSFLTGGFYGSLVRANTGRPGSPAAFVMDGMRSFWRLLLWNLLWVGMNLLLAGVVQVFPQANAPLAAIVLAARYLCLFVDVALVAERHVHAAFKSAFVSLLRGLVSLIPLSVTIVFLTGLALSLAAEVSWIDLLAIGWLYSAAMTWLLHMVTARYLWLANWHTGPSAASSPPLPTHR